MDLSIIIVSWNVREKLKENLDSIFSSETSFSFEVFVVDNNSVDGSVEMVEKNFPLVKIIKNNENLGFAKANNQAIKNSSGDFILLLNPDMKLEKDSIEKSMLWAKNRKEATVSSFKLINQKGEVIKHVRRFPLLFDQLMIILKVPHIFPGVLNAYLMPDFDYSKESKVDSIRGAFFLINKESYKKISGLDKPFLDERYFLWFEEVDFCREVYRLGGQVWYSPNAQCLDYIASSFSQVKRIKTQNYFSSSMLKYFAKWESRLDYFILKLVWSFVFLFIR